jgi:hypothetical protein
MIIELHVLFVKLIEGHKNFLPVKEFNINNDENASGALFCILGYPEKTTKLSMSNLSVKSEPISITSIADANEIYYRSSIKKDPKTNLIIEAHQKKLYSRDAARIESVPTLIGISGSGLWRLSKSTVGQDTIWTSYLAGIVCAETPDKKYLICTRIDVVSELLRMTFNLDLIPSNIVKLK